MVDPGLIGFLLGLATPFLFPLILCCLGFGCVGIRRSSPASNYQSISGDIQAGSGFAQAQSCGMRFPLKVYIFLALLLGAAGFLTGDMCFYESQDLQYTVISVQNLLRSNSTAFSFNNNSTSFDIQIGVEKLNEDISNTADMFRGGDCDEDQDCLDHVSYCYHNEDIMTDGNCTAKIFSWFIIVATILVIITFLILSCCCCVKVFSRRGYSSI